MEIF
jgi:hypothetical protein